MIRVKNILTTIEEGDSRLIDHTASLLKIGKESILTLQVVGRAVDARKGKMQWCWMVDVEVSGDEAAIAANHVNADIFQPLPTPVLEMGNLPLTGRPIIVGAGPAGLFAALELAQAGYAPLILERGAAMEQRIDAVDDFFRHGILDTQCNVQFGEGGAGTFSDGKLTARTKSPFHQSVIQTFIESGADPVIAVSNKPHIGTDDLRRMIVALRNTIIKLGGQFRFSSCFESPVIINGQLSAVQLTTGEQIGTNAVILATGHSARDTYESLSRCGMILASKSFAVGLRIEHPREFIDKAQYGVYAGYSSLGAADYTLKAQAGDRSVYSFCMCPGGVVINASSEADGLCVNGMSYAARDGVNSNSAIVCQVSDQDFGQNVLDGMAFQRELERRAYQAGGGGYCVPVQRVDDFLQRKKGNSPVSRPSVLPEYELTDLHSILPEFIGESIAVGIKQMDHRIHGFASSIGTLTGIETRTSSPVRIVRDERLMAEGIEGLFPCGEGAGYAGGIMSAAIDGIRAARALMATYRSQGGIS